MKLTRPCVLTLNGGSSSIKFSLYEMTDSLRRVQYGRLEGIGLANTSFAVTATNETELFVQPVTAVDYATAVAILMEWIDKQLDRDQLVAIGHRFVHGGQTYCQPERITQEMLGELRNLSPLAPNHLPGEILLADALLQRFPSLPQIACFDTAFHHQMPGVARLLAIPRRYSDQGLRRFGFHGLSCSYLLQELERLAGTRAAQGRVILAHLGNGASLTAVRGGESLDTSMGFTPAAGLPMSSRSGDLDPGLMGYLARTENMTAEAFDQMVNHESGLLGVSGTSADMRELLLREVQDVHAAEAVALFCYQSKKWLCAMAGALEGLDTLVFSGGIGEQAAEIRTRICTGLGFIGIELDAAQNQANAAIISSARSGVQVRIIATDEELVIAQTCFRSLRQPEA